ncbi:MAG: polymerase sigma factor RpoE [Labilithrix sp.]|nr:polymerase sigma factor RpoE [Labilithrix sp.]
MTIALGLADSCAVAIGRLNVDELFSAHVEFVWRSLRQLGVGEPDLEDQTQEVFIVAYRRYATWNGEHARGWLFAIARRCASHYRRRGHRRHEVTVDEVPESCTETDPDASLDIERLDRLLATLDEDKRAVFVLFEIEEMSMRAVAATVGCPVQTAYARLYAARRELARLLSEER